MLHRLRPRSVYDVFALLALIVAVGGTSAYAANTIGSTDIIDGQVKSADVGDNEINSADVKDQSLTTFDVSTFLGADVVDGTLTGADIQDESVGQADIGEQTVGPVEVINDSLLQSDIRAGAVTSDEVLDNSLIGADIQNLSLTTSDMAANTLTGADIASDSVTGTDINESTLAMPPTTTATFAGQGGAAVDDTFRKVTSKTLGAGTYAISATANLPTLPLFGNVTRDFVCELRNPSGAFIGGARDRRFVPDGQSATISLSMNGGVTTGGGEVGLYCRTQGPLGVTADGQIMIIRLDGFF